MLLADVNVFIHAHRADDPRSEEYRRWLTAALNGDEAFGFSDLVLSAFVRIVTNRHAMGVATPTVNALDFAAAVRMAPSATRLEPGPRHWSIFDELCREVGAKANLVPDAYLAALAIEHGATWVTDDRGFARFPGLRWRRPLET